MFDMPAWHKFFRRTVIGLYAFRIPSRWHHSVRLAREDELYCEALPPELVYRALLVWRCPADLRVEELRRADNAGYDRGWERCYGIAFQEI